MDRNSKRGNRKPAKPSGQIVKSRKRSSSRKRRATRKLFTRMEMSEWSIVLGGILLIIALISRFTYLGGFKYIILIGAVIVIGMYIFGYFQRRLRS